MNKRLDKTVLLIAVVGGLVLANVVGVFLFGRLDLTADKQYTLSEATADTLDALKEPVTVRAYFTAELPAPYSSNSRYVKDLLDEYFAEGGGNFRYEFIDPEGEETSEDKEKKKDVKMDILGRQVREATSVEKELQEMGIPPVQVRVNEGDKLEVKRAYMGLAIHYGDKKEVIPVVQETAGLEYDLTTLIRKLAREKTPKVGLVSGHEGPDVEKELSRVHGLLTQQYDVQQLDLTAQPEIPADFDAVLVIGPKTGFTDAEKKALDAFVMTGKGAAFLLDSVKVDIQTLEVTPTDHQLGDLLAAWGAQLQPGLVLDAECATISITQQRGFMRIAQPVRYPFMPMPRALDPEHPLTRGLSGAAFPFMSPVSVAFAEGEGVKADVLVQSSPRSWLQQPPYNLDPLQRWTADQVQDEGSKGLVVSLTGAIKSWANPEQRAQNARVLVAGGAGFVGDQFMSEGNQALALNMIDWLVLDEALLAVRSRGLGAAPLVEVSDGTRNAVKYGNIVGLPLGFVAFGLVRWRLREKRRREVSL